MGDWSAVYLEHSLGTSSATAALGFAAFSLTMAAGRFLGDRLVARFGTSASSVTAPPAPRSGSASRSPWPIRSPPSRASRWSASASPT